MIEVSHLTKCYGDFTAVNDLSFQIDEGHVYGFLGPNGAGKSTTMNIMTGCLSATGGQVKIDGCDIFEEPEKAKRMIGYLPEQPPLYMNETPEEYLRFVGEAKGMRGKALSEQIESVMEQTGLLGMRHRRISALSKGYKQRVGIAQALLGNPKVIILDEPTVGLDPIQIIEIRDLIRTLGKTHTVIFSSHILSEVQTICDRVLIIAKGRLIAYDRPERLEERLCSNELMITAEAGRQEAEEILGRVPQIAQMNFCEEQEAEGRVSVRLLADKISADALSRAVFFAFAEAGKALILLQPKKANLEEIFIELTEQGGTAETEAAQKAPEAGTPGPEEPAENGSADAAESEGDGE